MTKEDKKRRWIEIATKLKRWEIRFIELRNEGFGYNEIRDFLNKEFSREKKNWKTNEILRNLIYRKGRLNEAYLIYGEVIAEESFNIGKQIIKNAHQRATQTIVSLMQLKYPDHIRLSAAKEILDRNIGKANQIPEIQENNDDLEELRERLNQLTLPTENTRRLSEAIKGQVAKVVNLEEI